MISILFIAMAAICNAAMDSLEGWRIHTTIFRKLDQRFWDRSNPSPRKTIGGWKFDGWHCAKSLMIIFFVFGAVAYKPIIPYINSQFLQMVCDSLLLGAVWNIVMPNFYGQIFKVKL